MLGLHLFTFSHICSKKGGMDLIPESALCLAFGLSNNFYLKAKLSESLEITSPKRLLLQ